MNYSSKQEISQFYRFLKENGAFSIFVHEIKKQNKVNKLFRQPPDYLLSGTFTWRLTKNGSIFWRKLNDLYIDSLIKKNIKND